MVARISQVTQAISRGNITAEEGTEELEEFYIDMVRKGIWKHAEEAAWEETRKKREDLERREQELYQAWDQLERRERQAQDYPEEAEH